MKCWTMTDSSYIPVGQTIRQARIKQDMNQHAFSERLRGSQGDHWRQVKISRIALGDRALSFQEMMQVVDVLGVNALTNTHELDQR